MSSIFYARKQAGRSMSVMVDVICAVVAALAAIACAYIAAKNAETEKKRKKFDEKADARAKERAREARLQLQMINANSELTKEIALALKAGRANGNVEEGLQEVCKAQEAYQHFLEDFAMDKLA